jgi:ketosteroid isomerase-like protein
MYERRTAEPPSIPPPPAGTMGSTRPPGDVRVGDFVYLDGVYQRVQDMRSAAIADLAAFEKQAAEIKRVLLQQAEAWNRGDIDAFMEHYWKSDSLSFSSGGRTTRGWQATKDNYRRRYPTRDEMGKLSFSQLEITPIGSDGALVLGNWRLERTSPVGGNFSLVLRRIEGRWLIIHDHTSRAQVTDSSKPQATSQFPPPPPNNPSFAPGCADHPRVRGSHRHPNCDK